MTGDLPRNHQILLGSVERVQGARPGDESWRADALAGSRHSRWVDELREPLENHDLDRARGICSEVCRLALQDFAPALLLLPDIDRQRVQALTAYGLTLFDFVRQTGLEGERLTAINRWEFELESALDGRPPGQPVYVLMHHLEQQRPWPRDGFDRLHAYARRRCAQPRPADPRASERDARTLGDALVWLVSGDQPSEPASRLAAVLIRLSGLTALGDDLRRHRPQLPVSELPDFFGADDTPPIRVIAASVAKECQRLREMTDFSADLHDQLPKDLVRAARYCQLAAGKLLDRVEAAGANVLEKPASLSLPDRLALLLRSRWY